MLAICDYDYKELVKLKSKKNKINGEVNSIEYIQEINGLKYLNFSIPYYVYIDGIEEENHRIQYLIPEILIKYKYKDTDDYFIVNKIEQSHNDGKLFLNIECNHISNILNKKGLNKTFVDNIEEYTNPTDVYDGIGTAQQLLERILDGTGWTVGEIDVFYEKDGTTEKIRTLKCEKESTMEQLQKFAELFNGFLRFNGNKTIDFKNEIGIDRQVEFRYKYNIKSIQKIIEDTDLITRLYVEGTETDEGIVTIEEHTETGENYIDNFQYYITSGLMPQSLQDEIVEYNQNIKLVNDNIISETENLTTDLGTKSTLEGQRDAKIIEKQSLETTIEELNEKISIATGTEKTDLETTKTDFENQLNIVNTEIENLNSQIADYETSINNYKTNIENLVSQRSSLRKQFENDMQNFLKIGFNSDSNYVDSKKLYDDSVDLLEEMSMPKVSYSMNIIDLSDIPEYQLLQFDIGDIIGIVDERLKLKTKGRITKITKYFDKPWNTKIEIANFYTPFEELFQELTKAADSIKYKQEQWNRSIKIVTENGSINQQMLQKAFAQNVYQIITGTNNSVIWDNNGITIIDLNNTSNMLRMNAGIISLSADGGATWKVAMNAKGFNFSYALGGRLDIGQVFIYGGNNNSTFNWTEKGLMAYNPLNENQWIKFDKNGIVGTLDNGQTYEFSLTWNGLVIGNTPASEIEFRANNSVQQNIEYNKVKISQSNGIQVLDANNSERLKIADLGNDKYGIQIKKADGTVTFDVKSDGTVSITDGSIHITHSDGSESILDNNGLQIIFEKDANGNPYSYTQYDAQGQKRYFRGARVATFFMSASGEDSSTSENYALLELPGENWYQFALAYNDVIYDDTKTAQERYNICRNMLSGMISIKEIDRTLRESEMVHKTYALFKKISIDTSSYEVIRIYPVLEGDYVTVNTSENVRRQMNFKGAVIKARGWADILCGVGGTFLWTEEAGVTVNMLINATMDVDY